MSLQDDLTAAMRRLDELDRSLGPLEHQLEQQAGHSLDLRRVRTDAGHLRDSLTLLRDTASGTTRPAPQMVPVPDAPYDPALWAGSDAEDEGLGSRHGHAP